MRRAAALALAVSATVLVGCRARQEGAAAPDAADLIAPAAVRIVDLAALGVVPYDAFVLPLSSPDATHVATHFGEPPSRRTLLAAAGAEPPEFTAVRLYSLAPGRPARALATVADAVVLGRAADDQGVLVEAPQENGSRWIGRVAWSMKTGEETAWLVRDGRVNAFATLGPRGELAWSRRAPQEREFEIVIRRSSAEGGAAPDDLALPREPGESWLLPSFSADGSRLFALVLRGDELLAAMVELGGTDLASADGLGLAATFEPIARGATLETAWQCVASQQAWPVEPGRPADAFFYFDPQRKRLVLWRAAQRRTLVLPAGSLAGAYLDPTSIVLTLPTRALVLPLVDGAPEPGAAPFGSPRPLLEKLNLPRATAVDGMPLLLLAPERADIRVMGVVTGTRVVRDEG